MLKSCFRSGVAEAGCDEAGRGCLAGPVFAAAVILPPDFYHPLLNDSKKLNENIREDLRNVIKDNAIEWAVAHVDAVEIDRINILNASILAMHKALAQLKTKPGFIIVDGNRFKAFEDIQYQCVVKGDASFFSIAAASVIAKTYRDDFMLKIHKEFPQYAWDKNKGYPTKKHCLAIIENGLSKWHRRSFHFKGQLSLDFS